MARHIRSSTLETRTARLKLPVRKKATFVTIAPGIGLGYRRNQGAGTWVVRAADGKGGNWEKGFAIADDHEESDGEHVLTFWEAQDRARSLARGTEADTGRPATLAEALTDYEADLRARGGDTGNATRARGHLTPALLSKPVALLTARELRRWRDTLVERGIKPATINRTTKMVRAAANLAVANDPRIANRDAWRIAFAALPDAHNPRNAVLPDEDVRKLIAEAWAVGPAAGLLMETLAISGCRISQLAKLEVRDLQAKRADPRLMMPSSRKGKGKRIERKPVPIPASLAAKLRQAAGKRLATEALLLKADGAPWHSEPDDHLEPFAEVAAKAGLPGVTSYALRHSSIVRALLANVPIRIVADIHDTSVTEIERTYSKYIGDHADAVARAALLDPTQPVPDSAVPPAGRRP
jgi:integrase